MVKLQNQHPGLGGGIMLVELPDTPAAFAVFALLIVPVAFTAFAALTVLAAFREVP